MYVYGIIEIEKKNKSEHQKCEHFGRGELLQYSYNYIGKYFRHLCDV